MSKIVDIQCHKVVNSRADWTISTKVILENGVFGVETVPEGASKGEDEAISLPADVAVNSVRDRILPLVKGLDVFDQEKIDRVMIEADGTPNKSNLGGNSMLSVSLASVKAASAVKQVPLYQYLSEKYSYQISKTLPSPVFNIINGGKHAQNGLSFQEFMVIPSPGVSFEKAMEMGVTIYNTLKGLLKERGYSTGLGDEGGFAPFDLTPHKALDLITEAVSKNYKAGEDVFFGMDVAAESFHKDGSYEVEAGMVLSKKELMGYYDDLLAKHEVIYLEDPYYEKDYEGWEMFFSEYSKKLMIVADDLVVTNPRYLKKAIESKQANAVIVKPNQVGSLTETVEFIKMAQQAKMHVILSHRSGEAGEDTFISDLAVGVGAEFIKSGAPARGERVVKYNRLLDIFHELS